MNACQEPAPALRRCPGLELRLPDIGIVRRQAHHFGDASILATPPLDARVAHVHDDVRTHDATSWGMPWSFWMTAPTSLANPCPVTAEIANTSRSSSRSSRARTSSLPVSSHL